MLALDSMNNYKRLSFKKFFFLTSFALKSINRASPTVEKIFYTFEISDATKKSCKKTVF